MYFPALALQAITFVLALALGAAAVDAERSRKTWDKLRATEAGAGLALRARWLGILYRLRAPIALILLLRLLLALAALIELTAFGGHIHRPGDDGAATASVYRRRLNVAGGAGLGATGVAQVARL